MGLITLRNHIAFPSGDNSSDTLLAGVHWNLTTLSYWNYTYYSNGTLSNGSACVLLFHPYIPLLLSNGTFLNGTSCYAPIEPMKARSKAGLVFTCLFAASFVSTIVNLRKHGKLYISQTTHRPRTGQKWQWYWMLVVAAFAVISGITGIDVDRCYLPELPIVLSSIFWFLMLSAIMAMVWESVRHWGTWQQRQMVDPNPYLLQACAAETKVELYLPLLFYLCLWMNFFMIVPRPWKNLEKQHSENQTAKLAEPTATDIRFKLASLFLLGCWFTTNYSLWYSIKHYITRDQRNGIFSYFNSIPKKLRLILLLSFILVCYETACSFDFSISPLSINAKLGMVYGLGWGVPFLIVLVLSISGYLEENDDLELLRQRQLRDFRAGHIIVRK